MGQASGESEAVRSDFRMAPKLGCGQGRGDDRMVRTQPVRVVTPRPPPFPYLLERNSMTAAVMAACVGSSLWPAEDTNPAYSKPCSSASESTRYPMLYGVVTSVAAVPAVRFAACRREAGTGQSTRLPLPMLAAHVVFSLDMAVVKMLVVPLASARTTT